MARKMFGTDGIRGIAGTELTAEIAYELGLALVKKLSDGEKVTICIGKDTRASGDMLESALAAGICAAGADAVSLGIVPTPAVAYIVNTNCKFNAGVMISASHNPAEYNGLKVFASDGRKLPDRIEEEIEKIILGEEEAELAPSVKMGKFTRDDTLADKYIKHVSSIIKIKEPKKVLIDCANGSASACAASVFSSLGTDCDYVNTDFDGTNINKNCGSTHIEELAETVVNGGYDIAFAFDGDADRCLCLDEKGNLADGDKIISVIAKDLKKAGKLKGNTAVVTCLSNMGMEEMGKENGISLSRTAVGDRYVLEEMLKCGYVIGGEQSGHIILTDYATTGDGEVTAAKILSILSASKKSASELFSCMKKYPQVSENIHADKSKKQAFNESAEVAKIIDEAKNELGEGGRIIVRPSGTEPLIRLMLEGKDEEKIKKILSCTKDRIEKVLGE